MSIEPVNLEERVARLEVEVSELSRTVTELEARLEGGPVPSAKEPKEKRSVKSREGASEEILSWVDKSYILPRVATTSFIVVVALALRTATDSGTLNLQIGSFLGMLYAFALIFYGWFAYREKNMQAPVFTLWGTIVMCAVVVEAHRGFASVPTEMAYFVLALTGAATAIISRVNHVALPVFVGTLGMSFGAFAIDYPSPHFPYLSVVVILANIFAAYATGLLRASWMRWLLFAVTLFMIQIWDLKLDIYLGKLSAENLDFSIKGFFPVICLLALVYAVIALLGVLGKIQDKVSRFDMSLPVLNVLWFYFAGNQALGKGLVTPFTFGWVAMLGAAACLGVAWWLAQRSEGGALGTTSYALAGGLLMAFAAPIALGHAVISYALVALLAVGLAWLSGRRQSNGLRLVSYCLQIFACGALVMVLRATEATSPSLLGAVSSGLLAAIGFYHYFWARKNPPPSGEAFGDKLNKKDRGASLLLIAALFSGFFTLRVGLYQALDVLHMATVQAFGGAQSVLINVTAAILFVISLKKRSQELRNVAIVVTVIGACKVFIIDMVNLKGMPLMISVFTFGLIAALASVILGRWHKVASGEAPTD